MLFSVWPLLAAAQQLGASLYIAPNPENPKTGGNFALAVKVDSLEIPVNAIKGILTYNKERLEIINTSKIGSILNLWVEEPRFSNVDGKLRFAGGVPKPGFIGNGGTVLLVIFKAKVSGITTVGWEKGEVLAADGKGTNILTNLQNLSFEIESAVPLVGVGETTKTEGEKTGSLNASAVILISLAGGGILLAGFYFVGKLLLDRHDTKVHHIYEDEERNEHQNRSRPRV